MFHDFLETHREELLRRTRAKVSLRPAPKANDAVLAFGVPLFLDQLIEALRLHQISNAGIGISAARHGHELLRAGFTVAQVVHGYGDVCQAVTELATELGAAISTSEFQILNKCLDDAIAEAVTEYARQRQQIQLDEETERTAFLAHELRNWLSTASMSLQIIKSGSVGINGSTGAVLERSLEALRGLVDRTLATVRLDAGLIQLERIPMCSFLEEIELTAAIEAKKRNLELVVTPIDKSVFIQGDWPTLAAALTNLLQNAFKFSRPRGTVSLRTVATATRVSIEVEDQCGGLPPGKADELFRTYEQRGADRTGLGVGLSICRKAVHANGGVILVRDLPGKGCVFTVDLPRIPGDP